MPDPQPGDSPPPQYQPPVDPWAGADASWAGLDLSLAHPLPPPAHPDLPPAQPAGPPPQHPHPDPAGQHLPPPRPAPHTAPAGPGPATRSGPTTTPVGGRPPVRSAAATTSVRPPAPPHTAASRARPPVRPTGGAPGANPTPVRRRRRWPRRVLVVSVAMAALCCGYPGYLGWPIWQQYPARAELPASFSDLRLRTDPDSERIAGQLSSGLLLARPLADDIFAGVYTDRHDKLVTVFGATGLQLRPAGELEVEFARVSGEYALHDVHALEPPERGGHLSCGTGRRGRSTVVVCGWADHGSVLTAVFTRRDVPESADLLRRLHERIITRA